MRLSRWFRASALEPDVHEEARRLYGLLVAQARTPAFYGTLGVPDTLDGRFEMVALHVYVALRRLKQAGAGPLGQAVFDAMFGDMDRTLREIGVGDMSVGKRVKEMARALYGRIAAYDDGLAQPDDTLLIAALERNLYGTVAPPPTAAAALARYLRQAAARLEAVAPPDLATVLAAAPPPWPAVPALG